MYITNDQFAALEKALDLLPKGEDFNRLDKETQNIIYNADKTMLVLQRKKKKDNKRVAEYIKEKRKTNKNYAR